MRTKVTLVLLFLNVILFYYIFHYEEKWRAERAQLEARRRVLGPEVASIDSFTRTSRTGAAVRAEKRADTWWLTQPYDWPANPNAVARIVNELQFLEHETSFAVADLPKSGQTLADYGLDHPALTLAFTAAGKIYDLKIGDDTKIGSRLYVLSPDGMRIHVVGRSLADSLGLGLEELRAESIFTIPVFEVRSLNLQAAAPANLKVRLRREGAGWMFETPILARASKGAVEVTVNALNALHAKKFYDPADSKVGKAALDAPLYRVTLEGNARRETLLLGAPSPDGGLFAKVENKPVIFNVEASPALLESLRNAQESLRDTHVLDFDVRSVTAFTLATPGQPELTLQRLEVAQETEAWQLVVRAGSGQAPQTIAADTAIVQDVLQKLTHLTATKFLSDAPAAADLENAGFNRPERELTLNFTASAGARTAETATLTLQLGLSPERRDAAFARLTNAPFLYQVDPEILNQLPARALHYRQRLLRELPSSARVVALMLTDLSDNQVIWGKTADSDPGLTADNLAPANAPEARRKALAGLLTELRTFRARRFIADSFSPDHAEAPGVSAPWKYRLDLTYTIAGSGTGQNTSSSLLLTERLGGTTLLAGTAEFGGVTIEVTQPLLDALFALTYTAQHDPGMAVAPPTAPLAAPKTEPPPGK